MQSFQYGTQTDTTQTQKDQKKIEISSKLLENICLHFNIIISRNKYIQHLCPSNDNFADDSPYPSSMQTILLSIIRSLKPYFPSPKDEEFAEEINGTLIYLKKNIDIFISKNHQLTEKNISNITKISFMLSHKTYTEPSFPTKDYTKLLYTWPAAEQRKNLTPQKQKELALLDQKKLVKLEREFLNAINHELFFPTKKLISIYKIPAFSLFISSPETTKTPLLAKEEQETNAPSSKAAPI